MGVTGLKVRKLTELAMLTAVALILFVVELQIPNPFPIPGVKLGLANIITVYAVYHYRVREVFLLVVARILLGSFFGGGMMTLMYSMAGGLFCLVGMLLLKRFLSEKYIWICSVLGAIFHNIGQMTVACMVAGMGDIVLSAVFADFWMLGRGIYRGVRTIDFTQNIFRKANPSFRLIRDQNRNNRMYFGSV